ncbi:MAG: signal peptide peptidase SppA, partial [Candidatus Binataceae bacterium]
EEDTALADGMFNQIVSATAKHRHLSVDDIRAIIDRAPLSAQDGLKAHLLDRLEYEDQFDHRVRNYRGERHELVEYRSYARPTIFSSFSRAPRIAVIYGVGAIDRGQGGYDPILSPGSNAMGSDEMVKAFKDAREDSGVRAVVLRVNSPGGSVIASELIRRAAELCAKKKPVVVSMSGYAASGGYWISTPAAKIFAEPGTLTGSIGVLGGKFNVAGAMSGLGINSGAVTRGANAEMYDSFTDFTPRQQDIFRNRVLGDTYQRFVSLVAASRHLTVQRVDQIAQGRVWTGEEAAQNKLVDQIGGFDAALREAKVLSKIPASQSVKIEELPESPGLLATLFGSQILSRTAAEWRPPRTFAPILWMVQQTLLHRRVLGQVYCPLVPVM